MTLEKLVTFLETFFSGYILSFMVLVGLYALFFSAPLLAKSGYHKEALWAAAGGWFWLGAGILIFLTIRVYNFVAW